MSIYRCAACGSQNVSVDTQAAGVKYDYVKGAVGTVLLGAGGAAAGITNKEQRVYKCSDCGMTLTYPMPEDIKNMIDAGVNIAQSRKHLSIKGVSVSWAELTKLYKNIESGAADESLRQDAEFAKNKEMRGIELLKTRGSASEEEFNNAVKSLDDFRKKFSVDYFLGEKKYSNNDHYTEDNLPSLLDYISFLDALDIFYLNYFRFRPYENPDHDELTLFKQFLMIYISLNYYEKTGNYPFVDPIVESAEKEQFRKYIENNAFFVQLFAFLIKSDEYSDEETIQKNLSDWQLYIRTWSLPIAVKNCLIYTCYCSKIGQIIFPKYIFENGALYYNNLAFLSYHMSSRPRQEYDPLKNADLYFKIFPEKKEKYDLTVSEHIKSKEQAKLRREEVDKKKKDLKNSLMSAEKELSEYKTELEQLRKKVFGKKKAEERIKELEPLIANKNESIAKLNAEYKKLEDIIIPEPESEEVFNSRIIKEYDYFLIWKRIDE